MILDKKPLLLKAFALKALLLKPELLIKPDLLFRSDLLFKQGLLPGMGDLELKKLLLAAVLAPKVIAGLTPMFGASLGNIPLLLIEKLMTVDPGQLLMLLSSLSGGGMDGLLGAMGTDELEAQGAGTASWESVNSAGEPDITPAGAEEDARSLIIRFAREVGRQEGAEEEYASRAAEFVDQFLSPTGLTQEVARMMMTARQAVGNDIEGVEGNRAATDNDFLDGDMGGLLSLLGDLEALIEALGAILALCANSVGVQGSGPEQLLGTYEERLQSLRSAVKNAGQHLSEEEAEARFQIVRFAGEVGNFRGAPEEYVRIAAAFVDRFLAPAGLLNEMAQLIRQARKETPESDAVASNKTSLDRKFFVGGTIVS
ncbi:UNVERIFIED_CONTAM: hypothetical protein HHA_212030 [Hammondia hammondi]|eukprot:XP_008881690.1 hypothetical protein HHA_212030 [Hammondia hammondi]